MQISHSVTCDQLDCSKSIQRQPTDKTPEEVLQIGLGDRRTLYNFIRREGYPYEEPMYKEGSYDVGLSTMCTTPVYFLWIKLTIEQGDRLIEKYNIYESHR